MEIQQIDYKSEQYQLALELRNKILRQPLGLNLFDENLELEKNYFHLAAMEQGELIGTLMLVPMGINMLQMKQVAVCEQCRRQGVGRQLVEFGEKLAYQKGYDAIMLHARSNAIAFYQAMGYWAVGDFFMEVGIPHQQMEKSLTAEQV